jgi:hypothetical protein
MIPVWFAMTYLVDRARSRTRSALDGHPESGALSLEWLVIAGLLVLAAAAAALIFGKALQDETGKLP